VTPSQRNWLIVEGFDDRHSVIGLMKRHIEWPEDRDKCPVWIELGNSVDEILDADAMSAWLKAPNIDSLGIMLDANANPAGRYQRLCDLCKGTFPQIPDDLPHEGLSVENADGKRLGFWIMPDNRSPGYLETFLKQLVQPEQQAVWEQAQKAVQAAKDHGAPCHETHDDKAILYTWLAWQNPPGQSPGRALTRKILDPTSPLATPFVAWFRRLFQV
jgi:hypothetical protein